MGLISRVSSRTYRLAYRNDDSPLASATSTPLKNSFKNNVTSASLSATLTTTSVYPLDVVKTTLQRYVRSSSTKKSITYSTIIKQIYQENGIRGFYRGLGISLIRAVSGFSYYLAGIEYLSPIIMESIETNNLRIGAPLVNLFTASSVRASAVFLFLPLTIQKTRKEGGLAMDFSGKNILKHYKISLLPVAVRDAGNSGIYYMFYQMFKTEFNLPITVSAYCASVLACLITQPFDVALSQRQLFNHKVSFRHLFTSNILFIGLVPRLIRRPISATITWYTFEYLRELNKSNS